MRTFIGGQEAVTASEFEELALGFDERPMGLDRELFLGAAEETPAERAARLDAARDVLADLREQGETDEIAAWDALYADALSRTVPLLRSAARVRRAPWTGEAA
ncbi:hypothetical protein DMH02_001055 [Streptomyces sp. WAC 00631]|uniref:hypothetical protein n=1 Tax=Streptomyces sp. WAC 00631 TaxID=2203201 RepID=UPI000F77E9B8|nr:hypothetical protein [Streptomyces sp. WAC 00631]MCC5031890.1 hypothetical protein [Streptomyces sp. WAC 00631]